MTATAPDPHTSTFVIDTSVLLADPAAIFKFAEHDLVIPVVVLDELEAKRAAPGDLGWSARTALRHLEDVRDAAGTNITRPFPVNDKGGSVRIELNHQDQSSVPDALRGNTNDHRILTVACNLTKELDTFVTLVTKDLPLRLRASIAGVHVEEYRNEQTLGSAWSGLERVDVGRSDVLEKLRAAGNDGIDISEFVFDAGWDTNTNLIVTAGSASLLARVIAAGRVRVINADQTIRNLRGNSAEQRFAMDMLRDRDLPIVSLGGPAGTGKSLLALAAGIEAIDNGDQNHIIVFRQLHDVGGQSLGYLPGTVNEKMAPAAAAVADALRVLRPERPERLLEDRTIEVLPMTHIRGRSLNDAFVIIDEAQNVELRGLLAYLSRIGAGSKVVLTHDVAQRDNPFVGRNDGIATVIARLKGQPEFGHITLTKTERSRVAELATSLLDDGE